MDIWSHPERYWLQWPYKSFPPPSLLLCPHYSRRRSYSCRLPTYPIRHEPVPPLFICPDLKTYWKEQSLLSKLALVLPLPYRTILHFPILTKTLLSRNLEKHLDQHPIPSWPKIPFLIASILASLLIWQMITYYNKEWNYLLSVCLWGPFICDIVIIFCPSYLHHLSSSFSSSKTCPLRTPTRIYGIQAGYRRSPW